MRKTVHSRGSVALSEVLVAARKKAGLTQQELADRLKRHQSFVAKTENGERRVDVVEFLQIAQVLGADPVTMLSTVKKALG